MTNIDYDKLYVESLNDPVKKEEFIEVNTKLVWHVLKLLEDVERSASRINCDVDDLFQIGCIGLIKAYNTFNSNLGFRWTTYASRCIKNEILIALRRKGNRPIMYNLSDIVQESEREDRSICLGDMLGFIDPNMYRFEDDEFHYHVFKELESKLTPTEYEVYKVLRLDLSLTQKEIAKLIGISQSYVSRVILQIQKKLYSIVKRLESA